MFICVTADGICGSGDTPQEAYEEFLNYSDDSANTLLWIEGEEIQVELAKVVKQEIS